MCACASALTRRCWGSAVHAVRKRPPWPSSTRLAHGCCWPRHRVCPPRPRHGWSALAAPSQHHVPEKTQRLLRRLRLVGAFPFSLPFATGSVGLHEELFFFLLWLQRRKSRGTAARCPCGRALPAAPCQQERVGVGMDLLSPRRALWEPCGCQAVRGPPWGLVVGSRGHVTCKRVLWFSPPLLFLAAEDLLPTRPLPGQRSSQPPSAPHSEVPPGPWHVPGAIGVSQSCPRSVCAQQSPTAAAGTPGSEGLFASHVPALRDVLIYRGIV